MEKYNHFFVKGDANFQVDLQKYVITVNVIF